MKANSRPLNLIGNEKSEQQIFSALLKSWRKKLGYCSLLATVPAMLLPVVEAHSDSSKTTAASITEKAPRRERTKMKFVNRALLKNQSAFRLPHHNSSVTSLMQSGGPDECPGQSIPGGTYTATQPYTTTGNTTGANNTISYLQSFYYYYYGNYNTLGPDHVYSFVLTSRGPDPEIRISASSSGYAPMVYILTQWGGCPGGTGNLATGWWALSYPNQGVATLNRFQLEGLPLNTTIYAFVDSPLSGDGGSYELRMKDVTIASPASCPNPVDCSDFFVRQHYYDFLNREPEPNDVGAWLNVLNNCPAGDVNCLHEQRLTTSAGFFGSPEFYLKGYYVFRFYRTAFGRLPEFSEINSDMWWVSGQTPNELFARKRDFTNNFVLRSEFTNLYSGIPNANVVATLMNRYGLTSITTPDPQFPDGTAKVILTQSQLVSRLDAGTLTRAQALRAIADSDQVFNIEYNSAFVAMQYYGYLRRTPESTGFNSWTNYLNTHPGDFREMVRGFVDSIEYRRRFGQP
jgi:hypothetical protein